MNIHLVADEDPLYVPTFFREFLANLPPRDFRITGVDRTPALNQPGRGTLAAKLYDFYGPVDFTRLLWRYVGAKTRAHVPLLATALDRLLARHGIASTVVPDVNDRAYVERVAACEPDLLVSVAASQIFGKPLIAAPKVACLNVHSGPLPHYRGMLPVFWQMYDGRPDLGVTIHTMTPRIDIGAIVLRRTVPAPDVGCLDAAIRRMKIEGARALLELLGRYRDGIVEPVAMELARSNYRSFPCRAEARRFRAMGHRLL